MRRYWLWIAVAPCIVAQTCENYGIFRQSNSTCSCPPGLGGSDCSLLTCQNSIQPPGLRQLASNTTGCTDACSEGFAGVDCNVCTSAQSCTSAIAAYPDASSRLSGNAALSGNQTVSCNTSPYTYTQGFLDCHVINGALQSLYPGYTSLAIQKTVQPSLSLAYPFGDNGTALAQLYYASNAAEEPIEQFYCQASNCTQTNSTTTGRISYICNDLQCHCLSTATFCGGPGSTLNLTDTINSLQGPLDINCLSNNASSCNFKQDLLVKLFGSEGLGLSSCIQGECIREDIKLALQPAAATGSPNSLSPGVIAALAVIGAFVLVLAALICLGCLVQKRAARKVTGLQTSPLQAGIAWNNVSYSLNGGLFSKLRGRKISTSKQQTILKELTGSVPCGAFVAILGPSGAGKSTFVDILAGKRKRGTVQGSVNFPSASRIVGEEASKQPGVVIAFVDQDDVLPATSTVYEALLFAAKLKLPESVSLDSKRRRVEEVLCQLGLTEVAYSRIGSPEKRGISGGQRRRLSIGLELLAQPSILILDEPTSGLDSVSALRVVEMLRKISHGSTEDASEHSNLVRSQTTVIATLHQPSSRIFHSFDTVYLLAHGRQLYFGPTTHAQSHFSDMGYPLPSETNIADHLLEIASMDEQTSVHITKSAETVNEKEDSLDITNNASVTKIKPFRSTQIPATTLLTQLQVLSSREIRTLVRDQSLLLAHVAVACVLGVFIGGLYFQANETIAGFQNRIGSLFFLGSLLAFSALSALANFSSGRAIFVRERAGAFYSAFAWLVSRILFDIIPLRIVPTVLLGTIAYFMVGLTLTPANFFKFLLIFVEYSISVTLLNLVIAAVIPSAGVAILFAAVLDLFQMAYAGFFVNLSSIPPVLRWLQWLCPLKYALEAVSVNEVNGGLSIIDTIAGVKVEVSASLIMEILFGFQPNAYYRDVCILVAWIALFAILVVVAVAKLIREIR